MESPWYNRLIFESRAGLAIFAAWIGMLVGFFIPYTEDPSFSESLLSGLLSAIGAGIVAVLLHQIVVIRQARK